MRQKEMFNQKPRIITHSAMEMFRTCRVKWDYRYNKEIDTAEKETSLAFGSAIHKGLEHWFKYGNAEEAVAAGMAEGAEEGLKSEDLCKIQVMLEKYVEKYATEAFETIAVEKVFNKPLVNPATGRNSKTFRLSGKVDAVVKMEDGFYILEHKTTSDINEKYMEALEIKAQTAIYAWALEDECQPMRGVIYDILEKPGIRMTTEESEEDFEKRKAALLAKSKTGKTSAKRREAETVDDFMARCREKITDESFQRKVIRIDIERKYKELEITWRTAKDMIRPFIYRSSAACIIFGKVCPYLNLCRANGMVEACNGEYIRKQANEELEEDA